MRNWVVQTAIEWCQDCPEELPLAAVMMQLDEAWGQGIDDGSWLWTEKDVKEMVREVEARLSE